jgi:hypothetical protein
MLRTKTLSAVVNDDQAYIDFVVRPVRYAIVANRPAPVAVPVCVTPVADSPGTARSPCQRERRPTTATSGIRRDR